MLMPVEHFDEKRSMADTSLQKYFKAAVAHEASDLLMRGGEKPQLRMRGKLKALDRVIEDAEFEHAVESSLTPKQWQHYVEHGSVDIGFDLDLGSEGVHRFRVNVFRTRGRSALAARRVDSKILTFDDLYLPPSLAKVCEHQQGLVLLAGVTGSGKSTTIASMLDKINAERSCHIVTIEDPIEFLFTDKKAMINQREVGIDVSSFAMGLRALVRENPDVVLIGEMRDKETFEAALQASETGHLVFGTIHASSSSQAFARIYDLFPAEERESVRHLLAYQMQAIVYQKLLPTLLEGVQRVPAVEVLLTSPAARKFILDGREGELNEVMRSAREAGMQTFTDALVDLVKKQYIHPRVAEEAAFNADELKRRLRGID